MVASRTCKQNRICLRTSSLAHIAESDRSRSHIAIIIYRFSFQAEGLPGSTPNHPCQGLYPYPIPVPSPLALDFSYPEKQSRQPGVEWPVSLHRSGGMTAWLKEPRVR